MVEELDEGFWAVQVANEATKTFGDTHVICGGWSPSGSFHIGNAREIITGYAIHHQLLLQNSKSKLTFVIDDFDSFDRIPKTLKNFKDKLRPYLGKSIHMIPDPYGEEESYAANFTKTFVDAMEDWGLDIDIKSAYEMYQDGKYDKYLKTYLEKKDEVQKIMEEIAGNQLDSFVNVVCPNCGNLRTTVLLSFENDVMEFVCESKNQFKGCGYKGTTKIKDHHWKLKWRLDWPARQNFLKVTVEPAGKDHSVAGGSIDTSLEIHRRIFNSPPPIMPRYGFITMNGKKLSGSKGTGIPAKDLRKLLNPECYFFLVFKNGLRKDVEFNYRSLDYARLVDQFVMARRYLNGYEYPGTERQLEKLKLAVRLALNDDHVSVIPPDIGIAELLLVYQSSLRNVALTIEKFRKMGKITAEDSIDELKERLMQAEYWLDNYAPTSMKFEILETPPEIAKQYWTDEIKQYWIECLHSIQPDMSPEDITLVIRSKAKEMDLPIRSIYQAFYVLLLGKPAGPNASQLILTLGKDYILSSISKIE